jgi:hypothetical protein
MHRSARSSSPISRCYLKLARKATWRFATAPAGCPLPMVVPWFRLPFMLGTQLIGTLVAKRPRTNQTCWKRRKNPHRSLRVCGWLQVPQPNGAPTARVHLPEGSASDLSPHVLLTLRLGWLRVAVRSGHFHWASGLLPFSGFPLQDLIFACLARALLGSRGQN